MIKDEPEIDIKKEESKLFKIVLVCLLVFVVVSVTTLILIFNLYYSMLHQN